MNKPLTIRDAATSFKKITSRIDEVFRVLRYEPEMVLAWRDNIPDGRKAYLNSSVKKSFL